MIPASRKLGEDKLDSESTYCPLEAMREKLTDDAGLIQTLGDIAIDGDW